MATPLEHVWREYAFYLRGPAGLNTYGFTTQSNAQRYRAGVDHQPLIVGFPAPSDSAPDDFGILASGAFDVEIFDEPAIGGIDGLGADWHLLTSSSDRIVLGDASGCLILGY